MRKDNLLIVAVIPAYNEERNVAPLILRTQRFVNKVILCDDGSTDLTAAVGRKIGATVIRHDRNKGKGEALKTLAKEAVRFEPDIVVCLDCDGQHDPSEIPILIEPIKTGESDIVVGSRYLGNGSTIPRLRRIGLRMINSICKRTGVKTRDTQSGFRAFSYEALQTILSCDAEGYGTEIEQLRIAQRNGLRVKEVQISVKYDGLEQTSKKSSLPHGIELVLTVFRLIVEERPLKYLGIPGFLLTSLGGILLIHLLLVFNSTRNFDIPVAITALAISSIGLVSVLAAVTLHAIRRVYNRLASLGPK